MAYISLMRKLSMHMSVQFGTESLAQSARDWTPYLCSTMVLWSLRLWFKSVVARLSLGEFRAQVAVSPLSRSITCRNALLRRGEIAKWRQLAVPWRCQRLTWSCSTKMYKTKGGHAFELRVIDFQGRIMIAAWETIIWWHDKKRFCSTQCMRVGFCQDANSPAQVVTLCSRCSIASRKVTWSECPTRKIRSRTQHHTHWASPGPVAAQLTWLNFRSYNAYRIWQTARGGACPGAC